VISPLLSNIYLDDFDEIITDSDLKLVRYGDDFVILSRHQKRILEARGEVEQILESMDLDLHPDKTRITNFNQGFRFLGHVFVGDLAIPRQKLLETPIPNRVKDDSLRLVHREITTNPTAMQQALIEALKASEKPIPPPLFVLLGYAIRQEEKIAIASKESSWETGMATLYLVKQGTTVHRKQERFVVETLEETETEIPIQEVEQILIFGNIQLTAATISTCLDRQIPVLFLSQTGEYKGHLWSAEATDLVGEMAQFQRWQDEAFKLGIAREIVQGKLENSRQLLLRLNRKDKLPEVAEGIGQLANYLEAVSELENTTTIDQIRGYEGVGAAVYFPALGKLISNPGFSLTERNFHPPKDPVNSLLSFGYTLLLNNVLSLLLAEGLNPYLGNLHGAERPKAYLAFDLMEEFRSPIVDTLVMKLVNQKVLKPTDFTYPNAEGGIYLEDTARRLFLKHFEARICEKTAHPDVQESVSYRRIIQLQIKRYKKSLLGNQPYTAFRRMN
jgi:CRISPR-associated protein Cas1